MTTKVSGASWSRIGLLVTVFTLSFLCAPPPASAQSALDNVIAAAKKEGELRMVGSPTTFGGEGPRNELVASFNKKFGMDLKLLFASGPGMPAIASRIVEEQKASAKATTDLYTGNTWLMTTLESQGALREMDWAGTFPWLRKEGTLGIGVVIASSFQGIIYNPAQVKPEDAPRNYADLVDATRSKAWAGKLAIPIYADWIADLHRIWPKDKVRDFARDLTRTATGFIRYNQSERIVSGEFAVMANEGDSPYAVEQWASRGVKLGFVPSDNAPWLAYIFLGVPKHSSSPNLAALFAAHVASEEGQEVLARTFSGHNFSAKTPVSKYLAAHKVTPISVQEEHEYYRKGGDKAFEAEIEAILRQAQR